MTKKTGSCGPFTKPITVYMPDHEYQAWRKEARKLNMPLSTYMAMLVRRGREDRTPYHAHMGATYSLMSAMLTLRQIEWQEGAVPEVFDDILENTEVVLNTLLGPLPEVPKSIRDAQPDQLSGMVRDMAAVLREHLKKDVTRQ